MALCLSVKLYAICFCCSASCTWEALPWFAKEIWSCLSCWSCQYSKCTALGLQTNFSAMIFKIKKVRSICSMTIVYGICSSLRCQFSKIEFIFFILGLTSDMHSAYLHAFFPKWACLFRRNVIPWFLRLMLHRVFYLLIGFILSFRVAVRVASVKDMQNLLNLFSVKI